MPGTMSQADLVTDLKASLNDAAAVFNAAGDADFKRHLDHAALDFNRVRPRIRSASISLIADQDEYNAPADAIRIHSMIWGKAAKRDLKPWHRNYPGTLPRISIAGDPSARTIIFSPAPSLRQIQLLSVTCPVRYFAAHAIDAAAANTTIKPEDRALLLLRAQAEAMKELAIRGSKKPISLRDGLNASPKNGTPAALHDLLMKEFEALT